MDAFLQKPIPKQKKDVYIQLKSDKIKPNTPKPSSDTNQIHIDNNSNTKNPTLQNGIQIVDKSDNKLIKKEDFFNQSFEIPEEEQEPPPKVKVKKTKKKLVLKNVDQIEDKKKRVTPKPKEFWEKKIEGWQKKTDANKRKLEKYSNLVEKIQNDWADTWVELQIRRYMQYNNRAIFDEIVGDAEAKAERGDFFAYSP